MENESVDNIPIPNRVWDYLVEFNEQDKFKTIHEKYGVTKLFALTKYQIFTLFSIATERDILENSPVPVKLKRQHGK